ncbi:hypothetical protein AS888_20970 [Peribacillus simplex]|uniref:Uncharacterized protein n=1 Tax=Peribacillus simplex TaxID=1478 RepID=A0A109MXC0_9BACI|nr:hypothetical protein [Peribacillus simplex]KWW17983.1 hypothetical protein AS888_20970 [Peribacillus simplex]
MLEVFLDEHRKYKEELLEEIIKLENEESDLKIRYRGLDIRQSILGSTKASMNEEISDEDRKSFDFLYIDKIQRELIDVIPAMTEETQYKEFKIKYNRKIIEHIDQVLEKLK